MISKLNDLKLTTERLIIRTVLESDLQQIYPIHSNSEVNKYLPYNTWQNWEAAEQWMKMVQEKRQDAIAEQYVIERRSDAKLIGTCLAFDFDQESHSAYFGYVLARDTWKQGFMLEAMQTFVPALQKELSLTSLLANVERENIASQALLTKLGFSHVDTTVEEDEVHLCRFRKSFP